MAEGRGLEPLTAMRRRLSGALPRPAGRLPLVDPVRVELTSSRLRGGRSPELSYVPILAEGERVELSSPKALLFERSGLAGCDRTLRATYARDARLLERLEAPTGIEPAPTALRERRSAFELRGRFVVPSVPVVMGVVVAGAGIEPTMSGL
jgi:hypothetical protein